MLGEGVAFSLPGLSSAWLGLAGKTGKEKG